MSARPQQVEALELDGRLDARDRTRARLVVAGPAAEETAGEAVQSSRRWLTLPRTFAAATLVLLYFGYRFPTEQYLTPQAGFGYALGILGGSSMLLLLVYPLRKRVRMLSFIGTTKRWFQAHMALGIIGPVLVLFHANFNLGAVNSNVALACMLVVSGSGLFGRYFYIHIHHGLHGRKANLRELKAYAEKLRWVTTNVEFLPDLVSRLDEEERRILERSEHTLLLARPLVGTAGVMLARRRLRRYVSRAVREAEATPGASRARHDQLHGTARQYIDDRLAAARRVVEFGAFERLFSLWHAFHLPLFVLLLVAGVVHVVAVHVY
ncbi:MAG: hypothetical protein WBO04_06305 [Steroidobacteraceae bacterium]